MWCCTMMAVLPGTRLHLQLPLVLSPQLSLILSTTPSQSWLSQINLSISLEGVIGRPSNCVSDIFSSSELALKLYIPGSPENVTVGVVKNNSVRVLWEAVEDADYYTVSFSQAVGDDQEGLCRDDPHLANETVDDIPTASIAVGEDVGSDETSMLRAYTTYSVTVVAFSDVWGRTVGSEAVTFTTSQRGK